MTTIHVQEQIFFHPFSSATGSRVPRCKVRSCTFTVPCLYGVVVVVCLEFETYLQILSLLD
jgi:hypothetical protein